MRLIGWVGVVFGLSGCAALQELVQPPPERVVCAKLTQTCEIDPEKQPKCEQDLKGWITKHPKEEATLLSCVEGANSCGELQGCVVGSGIRGIGADVGGFIKGIGKSLGL